MVAITNNTRGPLSFRVQGKAKDGVPPTESVEAGETKDIDVDTESARYKGHVLSGAISVPGGAAKKAGAAPEMSNTGRK